MNQPEQYFERIEGPHFSACVNLASDFRTFLRILNTTPEVQGLHRAMEAAEVRLAVCQRVVELLGQEADPQYENPWDAALACYLALLSARDAQLGLIAASLLVSRTGFWWARKVATRALERRASRSGSGNVRYVMTGAAPLAWQTKESGEQRSTVAGAPSRCVRLRVRPAQGNGSGGIRVNGLREAGGDEMFKSVAATNRPLHRVLQAAP